MGITPWVVGQTRPSWAFTWLDDSKTAINLSGATVTLRFSLYGGSGYAMQGTVTVTGAAAGQFTYVPNANDFAAPGNYVVQARAVYGDGTIIEADLLYLTVNAAV